MIVMLPPHRNRWMNGMILCKVQGGSLVGEECRFAVVKHKWINNEWKIIKNIDKHINISIKDNAGRSNRIVQLENSKGELALGIMFAPNGDSNDEARYLKMKAEKWAEQVRTGHLKQQEAWLGLQLVIL
jgi:hypothetical protein